MLTTNCLLCANPELETVYRPDGTLRDVVVYLCSRCGLVQSRAQADGDKLIRSSSGADYGNLRTGKGFRAKPNLDFISDKLPDFVPGTILDVGASRGTFAMAALARWPDARITAIEPDKRLTVPVNIKVNWLDQDIETLDLGSGPYDLVYCSHTLEHLDNPKISLVKLAALTRATTGYLCLEVPNMDFIGMPGVIEEWFIDKHVTHFTDGTLRAMLEYTGWRVVEHQISDEYLTVLAARSLSLTTIKMSAEPYKGRNLIKDYEQQRKVNLEELRQIAERWNKVIATSDVLVWGAGRIYNALVKAGLDAARLMGVVDLFAPNVTRPVVMDAPAVVLVASREYYDEIRRQALEYWPDAKVRRYDDPLL